MRFRKTNVSGSPRINGRKTTRKTTATGRTADDLPGCFRTVLVSSRHGGDFSRRKTKYDLRRRRRPSINPSRGGKTFFVFIQTPPNHILHDNARPGTMIDLFTDCVWGGGKRQRTHVRLYRLHAENDVLTDFQ